MNPRQSSKLATQLTKLMSALPASFHSRCTALVFSICAAFTAHSLPAPGDAPSSEWRQLFNGHDLTGWSPVGSARWRVEDGIIVGGQDGDPKRSGLLTTKEQFKDFVLE